MLLRVEGLARSIGARTLFRDAGFDLARGDRLGLVGANGAGKTSLLRILAGLDAPDSGRVLRAKGVRIGLLRQEIDPGVDRSVREEVGSVLVELDALAGELQACEREMAELGRGGREIPAALAERYDRARHGFEAAGGFDREARIDRILAGLGFRGDAPERALASFSGGWRMRVELAKLLLASPDVLLLDEPTNHLDLPSIEWFEEVLAGYPGGVVLISHDRSFLRRHVDRVAEIEAGRVAVYPGRFEDYLRAKQERRLQLEAEQKTQQRQIAETERFIERFRYKASKARQVQSRVKALEKVERIEMPQASAPSARWRLPEPPRSGEVALRLGGICKAYGAKPVYAGVDLQVRRGEKVALVGANGAGKSTLLRIAAGALAPDAGSREVGHNVVLAYYAQHQLEMLEAGDSVLASLERVARVEEGGRLRGHLGAFLFSGEDVDKKVAVLSGGEKARLALARMLLRPVNFLVLDEPTNHLDLAACERLEAMLVDYAGSLLFVSHDRDFIDALATRVVEVEAGRLTEYLGNYDDYRRRRAAAGDGAPPPGAAAAAQAPPPRDLREAKRGRQRECERLARRLERIEHQIATQERAREALDWRLADPSIASDAQMLQSLQVERDAVQAALEAEYRGWETLAAELEETRAELEAQRKGA